MLRLALLVLPVVGATVAATLCPGCLLVAEETPSLTLAEISDQYWNQLLRAKPLQATRWGYDWNRDRLPDLTGEHREKRSFDLRYLLAELRTLRPYLQDETSKTDADVLSFLIERELGELEHRFYERGLDQMYGPQVWLLNLPQDHPMGPQGRKDYLERLRDFPRFMEEYLANLRQGLGSGNRQPQVVVDRVLRQVEEILEVPEQDSPLVWGALNSARKKRWLLWEEPFHEEVVAAVKESVYPAFRRFRSFLALEYQGAAEPGLHQQNGGESAYVHRIWYHTSLRKSPGEIHQIGLDLMESLQQDMLAIAQSMGHEGDLAAFQEQLLADPANVFEDRKAVTAAAGAELERAKAILPALFHRQPKAGVEVKALEAHREKDAPAGYYHRGSGGPDSPGTYYVNTSMPEQRPRFNLPALTLHEAVPGHHFQAAWAEEMDSLPEFRRRLYIPAFGEGWALYAELLGEEQGLYETPLQRFGMLTYQAWRAARLVVDTGIHGMGWSREQALDYFRQNLALPETEIQNEIDRYIMWPGQSLAYMLGSLEIQRLRQKAERRLGDRFDVRDFHGLILSQGSLPLAVLEKVVDRWLEKRATGRS
ncbi:MAG: DUF885 domain-containing protein [Planctomycetota bacterium]|nr:MAG: DUF885 domain-containing protein [Planctomycetota bacterium]